MASENEAMCKVLESSLFEASSNALVPAEVPKVQITEDFQGAAPESDYVP